MSAVAKRAPHTDLHRKQRGKNLALMAALLAFCVLVYLVTVVRMGGG